MGIAASKKTGCCTPHEGIDPQRKFRSLCVLGTMKKKKKARIWSQDFVFDFSLNLGQILNPF